MTNICILGQHTQGLIAACLLAKDGHKVTVCAFPDDTSYDPFYEECKTGPVSHVPFLLPKPLLETLDVAAFGFDIDGHEIDNPFRKLPFCDGLKKLLQMFRSLDYDRPLYKEKAWRDAWGTFEIGRVLADYDDEIQALFARSMSLSLTDLLDATDLNDSDKAYIVALCVLGSKTNPADEGTAASILPALMMVDDGGDFVHLQGSIYDLSMALKQSAKAQGVQFFEEAKIRRIVTQGNDIQSIIMDDETELGADGYILDIDPIRLFDEFLKDMSVPPAFKNRVYPTQNLKECVSVKMVYNGDAAMPDYIAPTMDYIIQAKTDMKAEGGSQKPLLSIIDVTKDHPDLGAGQRVFDILAQYFEPDLDNDPAILQAVSTILESHVEGFYPTDIVFAGVVSAPPLFGQPTFNSSMPLLQLFKVFSGHHAIAYDLPIANAVIAGYGGGCAGHYHVFDGGARVANLYESD